MGFSLPLSLNVRPYKYRCPFFIMKGYGHDNLKRK